MVDIYAKRVHSTIVCLKRLISLNFIPEKQNDDHRIWKIAYILYTTYLAGNDQSW